RPLRKRSGPAFFARAQASLPEIDEGLEPCLQRDEAESLRVVRNAQAVETADGGSDAGPRFHRRPRQASREVHVVLGFELAQLGFEPLELAGDLARFRHYRSRNQTSGSHNSRA